MVKIVIQYNGNKNKSAETNHLTFKGIHQLQREFDSINSAICFWLECEFYSGAITTLEEILPVGYESELLNILHEEPVSFEEVILEPKHLYQLTNDDDEILS